MRRLCIALVFLIAAVNADAQMEIGLNVGGGKTHWDGPVYSNLMRQAGTFTGDAGWPKRPAAPLGIDGWPTQVGGDFSTPFALIAGQAALPAGTYTVAAKGKGEVEIQIGDGWTKRVKFTFDGSRSIYRYDATDKPVASSPWVVITKSDPSDRIRDIEIVTPDAGAGHPFRTPFVDELRGAKILRFMDARSTNNSVTREWADETALASKWSNGWNGNANSWPISDCITLANVLKTPPWLCIPYHSTDDYVRQMARQVDCELDQALTIYVELSNELWNWGFQQAQDALADSNAMPPPRLSYSNYHGLISARKLKVFKDALPAGRKCVRVIPGQAAGVGIGTGTVANAAANGGFEAISCAPYFQYIFTIPIPAENKTRTATDAENKAMLVEHAARFAIADAAGREAVLASMFDAIHAYMPTAIGWAREWKSLADKSGVPLLLYEGGQHLPGSIPNLTAQANAQITALGSALNRDPRMGAVYARYLADLQAVGVKSAVLYISHAPYGGSGYWGHREYPGQTPIPPKARAVADFLASP